MTILTKRIYDAFSKENGYRVLVDRLWPRGIKKVDANIDEWAKEVTPSTDLRNWWHEHSDKYAEFTKKYKQELNKNDAFQVFLDEMKDKKTITLISSIKDIEHSHVPILKKYIEHKLS